MSTSLKDRIIKQVLASQNESLLEQINEMLGHSESDFYDELPSKLKTEINLAIKELNEKEGIPHDQVMKEVYAKYYRKTEQ